MSAQSQIEGTWNTDIPFASTAPRRLAIRLRGDSVAVTFESAPFNDIATGTYDSVTRRLLAGDPTFRGVHEANTDCTKLRVDAVLSEDGATLTGNLTATSGFFHGFCTTFDATFTATRATCGNFRIDPGESCDRGDVFANDDCCSKSCTFEPAGAYCSVPADLSCAPSAACVGGADACMHPVAGDTDADGIIDTCDLCEGVSSAMRVRMRVDDDVLVLSARVRRPPGDLDPSMQGLSIVFAGTGPSEIAWFTVGGPGTGPGAWIVKRAGRRWEYVLEDGTVAAKVRLGRRLVRISARDRPYLGDAAALLAAPLLSLKMGWWDRPAALCGQIDRRAGACRVRKHATVCRQPPRRTSRTTSSTSTTTNTTTSTTPLVECAPPNGSCGSCGAGVCTNTCDAQQTYVCVDGTLTNVSCTHSDECPPTTPVCAPLYGCPNVGMCLALCP